MRMTTEQLMQTYCILVKYGIHSLAYQYTHKVFVSRLSSSSFKQVDLLRYFLKYNCLLYIVNGSLDISVRINMSC